MIQAITILILSISLIFNGLTDKRQKDEIGELQQEIHELRWDYISHKKIEECRGLGGGMDYEGASECYSNDVVYRWSDEGSHWQVYKTEGFDEHEIFRMQLNSLTWTD